MASVASPQRLLWRYIKPHRVKAILLISIILLGVATQLLTPQLLSRYIDASARPDAFSFMFWLAITYLIAGILQQGAGIATSYVGQDVGWSVTNDLREDLARHCLQLDMSFHNKRTPGELIERVDGDLTALANFFAIFLTKVGGSVLLLAGIIVLLTIQSWIIGLVMLGFALTILAILYLARRSAARSGVEERSTSAAFIGFLDERLAGIDDIRANGAGPYVMRRYYEHMWRWINNSVHVWLQRSLTWNLTGMLFTIKDVILFGISAWLYFHGQLSLGTIYLFFQYNVLLQGPLEEINQQMPEFQKAAAGITRTRDLLGIQPTIISGKDPLAHGALGVEFADVTFSYAEGETPVLHDLSFRLEPGETLGLLGRTGSGKTTITRLLFRLYDTSTGTISIGGENVRKLDTTDLRKRIGLVTQEVQLFHASVRDNLTFFDASIGDERIMEVIETIGLMNWFSRLPDGLDTMLEAGGSGLSAGESQLLAFVRVFLKDPGMVILDEPSSRVDPATEAMIELGMRALLRNRTGIIIAHRLATVQRVDRIMVLDNGRILEEGSREALARNRGSRFAELLQIGLSEVLA